jgi:class 3 adenylate cyclase/tetratricopeptide (TPR) repeat protein
VAAPVAERRLVSVLFADLVGFTTLAEGRDAEETRELLSRYFDLATDVVARYGGTVEKFIGDAVMAVWGAPTAHEDDAERAVRAALELVDAVKGLGPTIQARAGVLTGEAAVTLGATNQGMVAGDLVNTASRLQSVAPPGTVLVGEATQRAAGRAIAFEEAGEQTLKGKSSPVPAWRVLRVVAQVGGRNRAETLEAPFVGRDDELRLLKELFHATTREGRARLVSVIGPAGIGKTRLAWEFLKYLDGLVEPVWYHDGRSPAYGEGISFWALGEMVRARAGLVETDDEPTTRAKVAATLAEHVPDAGDRGWIEPAVLTLLGVESGIGAEQLFGAWRTLFERLAASAPVVLVFEDFHYADAGLLDFVDHLLEWSRNVPIYVVTLARPELVDRRPNWGAGKRNFTSLYLEPLSESAMRELLAGLVPGLPAAAAKAIVARADGIPLYAVETVRMLVANGRLAVENGTYRPSGDLTSLAVPETLTALIASRLDGLDPAERTLLQCAAVLGQSFTLAGLAAVSGIDETDLEPHLRTLVRRELLTLEADPRSPERGQYAFVQALIREVAYGTLAKKDRKARHLAAARHFEGLGSDELAGALAGHYLAAHANASEGPEGDALAGQSRIALRAAAERAASLGAHDQAVTFLTQALTVTSDPTEEAELLERAGTSAGAAARVDEAETLLQGALDRWRELGDRPAVLRATAGLGTILLNAYRVGQALKLLEPASAEFADLAADLGLVMLDGQLARAYMLQEHSSQAIAVAERVLAAAEHRDLLAPLADALITKGTALTSLGRGREGAGVILIGEQLAREAGLPTTLLRAVNNRLLSLELVDPAGGLEAAREGLTLARRLGHRPFMFNFVLSIGWFGFMMGDWDGSLAQLDAGLADEPDLAHKGGLLRQAIAVRAGRGEAVEDALTEIEEIDVDQADPQQAVDLLQARAAVAFAAGNLEAARAAWKPIGDLVASARSWSLASAARAALWAGDAAGAREDLAELDVSGVHGPAAEIQRTGIRAGLAALEGRPADALTQYRQASRGWRDVGYVWLETLTAIDMATLLDPAEPEVQAAAEAGRETLTRLRARPFLARLDAALGREPGRRAVSGRQSPTTEMRTRP